MGIDLSTVKRGNQLLTETKKAGRKKIADETNKQTEKIITYVTKTQKETIDAICKKKHITSSQYFRTIVLDSINDEV